MFQTAYVIAKTSRHLRGPPEQLPPQCYGSQPYRYIYNSYNSGGEPTYRACHKLIAAAVGWRTTYAYGKASVKQLHLQLIAIFCTRSLLGPSFAHCLSTASTRTAHRNPSARFRRQKSTIWNIPARVANQGMLKIRADHCVSIGYITVSPAPPVPAHRVFEPRH